MDRKKAEAFVDIGKESSHLGTTKSGVTLTFARADDEDITWIENLSNKELLNEWAGYVQMTEVLQCFSIRDLQIQNLLEMEISARKLVDDANALYDKVTKDLPELEEV